ncbi:hypothetical protein EXIGLDRAFT_462868 [Exidia glandulosa HHB12029]|uniref:Uncharacterized protein n=1 Tax=Exidia glandulosa HHB12029 TaxID=1314781 RepID=A0A165K454_EXIGL|nr:hypothetical protein EXIGLDRAFT_462868 [Exidia glandulosa HHB12029]
MSALTSSGEASSGVIFSRRWALYSLPLSHNCTGIEQASSTMYNNTGWHSSCLPAFISRVNCLHIDPSPILIAREASRLSSFKFPDDSHFGLACTALHPAFSFDVLNTLRAQTLSSWPLSTGPNFDFPPVQHRAALVTEPVVADVATLANGPAPYRLLCTTIQRENIYTSSRCRISGLRDVTRQPRFATSGR